MSQNSKIEWTDHTINLWWGCTKVNPGCFNCYADTFSNRFNKDLLWGEDKPRKAILSVWSNLNSLQRKASKANVRHRVFVGSMMDIFEKNKPILNNSDSLSPSSTESLRIQLFENISNNLYPNLIFLFLTKRPSNIKKFIPESWKINPPKNVMFGCSVVDQKSYDTTIKHLLNVKGYKFLSMEPQLEEINLNNVTGIDWIIQGGESGHHRREFNLDWAKKVSTQCKELGIAYFFKQIDKVKVIPEEYNIRNFPDLPSTFFTI